MSETETRLPRLQASYPVVPGVIKSDYEDFQVEELPLYDFSGEGTHTYFLLEKAGLTTMQAVHDLARVLEVRRMDIGYAGLKDARAVTRQWMSVEHIDPERLLQIELPRMKVLDVTRHGNKLKLGHLRANAFQIRVRDTNPNLLARLQDQLRALEQTGVPNYFGRQRFGARGDSWRVGEAMIRGDLTAALDQVLGRPGPLDRGDILRARELYEEKQYGQAFRKWPGMYRDERRALRTMERTKGNHRRAFLSIDRGLRKFYVSAYQSHLFNRIAADRVRSGTLGTLETGDLAEVHRNGAVFEVLDGAVEQPRADAFEISPSGPLYGYRMTEPGGAPGRREAELLESSGLTPRSFSTGALRVKGARRGLRFQPRDARIQLGADERGAYLQLHFVLPKGSYATALLRELFDEGELLASGERGGLRERETPAH